MAKNTKPQDQWDLNDYIEYLSHSSRLSGVAKDFEEIFSKMNSLNEYDQTTISYDMTLERSNKIDTIIGLTSKYIENHQKDSSSTSKERCEIMKKLGELCEKEKSLTSLDANIRYFKGKTVHDVRTGISEADFRNLEQSIIELESKPMTEENVIAYTNTITKYVQAAESYLHGNKEKTGSGQKFLKKTDDVTRLRGGLSDTHTRAEHAISVYKPCLDSARDLKKVRALIQDGKSWNDLLALRTAHHSMQDRGNTVGANVSQRIQTNVNNTKGFFTKETIGRLDMSGAVQRYIDQNPTKIASIFSENKTYLSQISVKGKMTGPENTHEYVFHDICSSWNALEISPEKMKMHLFLKDMKQSGMPYLKAVTAEYINKLNTASPYEITNPVWIKDNYSKIVKQHVTDPKLQEQFLANSEVIVKGIEHNSKKNNRSDAAKRMVGLELITYNHMLSQNENTVEGLNAIYAGERLLKSEEAKKELISLQLTTHGASDSGTVGKFDDKDQIEITGRNVLMTRVAEMLNVGHLVAHSERMTMEINGVVSNGCFMEYAKGMDAANATSYTDINEFLKVDPNRLGPGLARDSLSLSLLDVICAQYDRHSGNFFTILGPENEKGEREVIGLQGIDNDQAFSRHTIEGEFGITNNQRGAGLNKIKLIDNSLADRILAVTPEMIDYVCGDIINEHEKEALMTRINQVKECINSNHFIRLNGDLEWDLDRYKNPKDEHEKRLNEIAKDLQVDVEKNQYAYTISKSNIAGVQNHWRNAKLHLEAATKQHEREEKDLQDYKDIVTRIKADDVMPQKKSADDMRAKRAAIFDKLVAEKEKTAKTEPKVNTPLSSRGLEQNEGPNVGAAKDVEKETMSAKVPKKGVLTSVKELEQHEKPTIRSRTAVPAKEPKKEDLGYGFIEITKDDIEKANKRLPNLKIGGHRGPKK